MQGKKKPRVRLDDEPPRRNGRDMTPANTARDLAFRNAPRTEDGRIVPGFRYKQLVDAYAEAGLEPRVMSVDDVNLTKPPLFLSQPEKGKRLLKLLREGNPYTTCCRVIGISRQAFIEWMQKGRDGHPHYVDFYEKVCKAEGKAEQDALKQLKSDGRGDWKSSAWRLERRWPEHWGRRDSIRAEINANVEHHASGKKKLADQVVQDEIARDLARRMIDATEYGYEVVEK